MRKRLTHLRNQALDRIVLVAALRPSEHFTKEEIRSRAEYWRGREEALAAALIIWGEESMRMRNEISRTLEED